MKPKEILRGQRLELAEVVPDCSKFEVISDITGPGLTIHFLCLGLDLNEKLLDNRYIIFFKRPSTPCGGINIHTLEKNIAKFTVDLGKLSNEIHQLVFAATTDSNTVMSQLSNGCIKFILNGNERACFSFVGSDFSEERTLILLSIYLKKNVWRTSAIGQGFYGGLNALIKHFSGVIK